MSRHQAINVFLETWSLCLFSLFLFLPIMSLFRVLSWLTYGNDFPLNLDLLTALWIGLRFDSVVLFYVLTLPSLILCLGLITASKWLYEKIKQFLILYLIVFLLLIFFVLAVDHKYYSYFQDHINILVFGFAEDDTLALIKTFWRNYPVIIYLLGFFFGAIFINWLIRLCFLKGSKINSYFSKKIHELTSGLSEAPPILLWISSALSIIFVIVVCFIGGRGSFGLFPLGPADTVISKEPFINYLTYNGVHALYRAIKLRQNQSFSWDNNLKYFGYNDAKQAFADFYQIPIEKVPEDPLKLFHHKTDLNPWAEKTHPHVVLIVMESFGEHWLRYHSKEFNLLGAFEEHTKSDVFLRNFLPSTGSTTGSLSSLMISSPHRPIGNFLTESQYLQVPFRSSPARIYAKNGYETRFIYGGNPGWRDMNKFARFQGFEKVEGDIDIENKLGKLKETHDWGVYDEDVFSYLLKTLSEAAKPQMLLVMTTTNHPPYQTPSYYKAPAQKIPLDLSARLVGEPTLIENRFKTYLYSTEMLGRFISQIKSSKLAENTIIAVTGDHGFNLINFTDGEVFEKWAVPFYLYTPPQALPKIPNDTFGSHMDIFPTLYSASLSGVEYDSLGENLADSKISHFALHSSGLIANKNGAVLQFEKTNSNFYAWQEKYDLLAPTSPSPDQEVLATKFRSMMSLLDYYLMKERQNSSQK